MSLSGYEIDLPWEISDVSNYSNMNTNLNKCGQLKMHMSRVLLVMLLKIQLVIIFLITFITIHNNTPLTSYKYLLNDHLCLFT